MEKTELNSYRAILREKQQIEEQLRVLESSMYSPKGQRFSSTPRASSGFNRTMADPVARHIKLEDLYRSQLAEKEARQLAIEQAIASLPDAGERLVLRFRYIEGRGWPAVVHEMQKVGISERTAYRLHGLALLKLKEL